MNTRVKNIVWGILTQYLYQIIIMVLQILVAPLLLKNSGSAALGGYASLMQYIGYLTLLDLGFTGTLTRYLSQAFNDPNDEGRKRFINIFNIGRWYLFSVCAIMGLAIAGTSFILPGSMGLSGDLKSDATHAMLILAVWYSIRFYFTMFSVLLYATQDMKLSNICMTAGIVVRFSLTLLLIHLHYGITGIVLANVAGDFTAAFIQMIIFKRKHPSIHFSWRIYNKSVFKNLFSFGIDAFLINIATRIVQSSTTFITGILLGAVAAAHYYSMSTPIFLIFTFVNMIMYNILPSMNEMVVKEEWVTLRQTYTSTFRLKMTILLPAVLGLLLFHQYITTIWVGASQYEGFYFTVVLCFYLVVVTVGSYNENVLIVLGNIRWFARLQILSTVIGLLLTLCGGYLWGLKGIVLGNLLAITPVTVYVFFRVLKQLHIPFRFASFFPPLPFIFSTCGVSLLIYGVEWTNLLPISLLQVAVAAVLFFVLILFTGIDKTVRQQASKQLLKMIKR